MSSILEEIKKIALERNFSITNETDQELQVLHCSYLFFINITKIDEGSAYIYLTHRTHSGMFPGERTDLHDVYSILFAWFLRTMPQGFSSILWDVGNPAIDIDTEIYMRYITLPQPDQSIITKAKRSLTEFEHLCDSICGFQGVFPRLLKWDFEREMEYKIDEEVIQWARKISEVTGASGIVDDIYDDDKIQYCQREGPDWRYYRSIREDLSILHSPYTARLITDFMKDLKPQPFPGVNGNLYNYSRVRSFVSFQVEDTCSRILANLTDNYINKMAVVPLGNKVLFTKGEYLMTFTHDCDLRDYNREYHLLERRHRKEETFLFPVRRFTWNQSINYDRFEDLILELIRREPGVKWVRKVGRSSDPDRGKDLIAEWMTPVKTGTLVDETVPPMVLRKVLVQVKSSRKSIGKSTVSDIRDMIDDHNASGFFLAVSSQITSSLTDHLYRLRDGHRYWVDWWNRIEIEDRLHEHPDIAQKYVDIVVRVDQ